MDKSFSDIGVSAQLAAGLEKMEIKLPTAIQAAVIPPILAGQDVIGQSATGTGKTLAYLLPVLEGLDLARQELQAIILAPTHELAMQIHKEAVQLAEKAGLPLVAVPIIGQVNITRQVELLKARPHLIVGSSGRILELIQKRKINSQTVKTIVIDEADRLLDDNNLAGVQAVIKTTQKDRRLLFFSATMPLKMLNRAKELTATAEVVAVKTQNEVPPAITHVYFMVEQRDKFEMLRKLALHLAVKQAIVFINQSEAIETTVAKLSYHGLKAAGIYGAAVKADRHKAITDFRSGKINFLVASDIAARGLDIKGVDYIFNLELPKEPQGYLHRAGRTGRAGKSGSVISLVDRRELDLVSTIGKALKIKLAAKALVRGKVIDSAPPKASAGKKLSDKKQVK